jgi:hypothetical protein
VVANLTITTNYVWHNSRKTTTEYGLSTPTVSGNKKHRHQQLMAIG